MIFAINENKMDHYSVFTSLSGKYGKPASLSPSESVWADGVTQPVGRAAAGGKVHRSATFDAIKAAGAAEVSMEELLRADFLDSF